MHEDFDEEELQPAAPRHDTELTLGPVLLLGLALGLVVLCGLCFGLGYTMGSHGAHDAVISGQQPGAEAASQTAGSSAKPSAAPQNISHSQGAAVNLPPSETSEADSQAPDSASAAGGNSAQPVVKPALPASATAPIPVPRYTSAQPAPAFGAAPSSALLVQIATVSHQEDAEVLVGALRKHGYAVTVRRDPADGQFHVQIGPFASRNDANAARQKLLNDGYNAIVQP
jgi:cell division septation protein DedD